MCPLISSNWTPLVMNNATLRSCENKTKNVVSYCHYITLKKAINIIEKNAGNHFKNTAFYTPVQWWDDETDYKDFLLWKSYFIINNTTAVHCLVSFNSPFLLTVCIVSPQLVPVTFCEIKVIGCLVEQKCHSCYNQTQIDGFLKGFK